MCARVAVVRAAREQPRMYASWDWSCQSAEEYGMQYGTG